MSQTDDFKNEFPLLYKRLSETNKPGVTFGAGTLRERVNEVMGPLGFKTVLVGDPLNQTLADAEKFLEAES